MPATAALTAASIFAVAENHAPWRNAVPKNPHLS